MKTGPANQKRQLAAILFADIAGYTSLMQKDEATARQLLDKFHFAINSIVDSHHGQVVNNYGDGCLCTFNSAVAAVQCAKELQEEFQVLPKVPVRIGLHSGDVFFEKDNVYGDSVNVASRIESMGVPGAVLFSKKIRDEIKNQPDIKIKSLGSFAFKNVEEPMEVFALANEGFVVPKRADMQGKLKAKSVQPNRLSLILPLILLLGFVGFWFYSKNKNQLPDPRQTARTAVLPFENLTNKAELEIVGRMAADWITEGLMNLQDVKVVSFNTVKENLKYVSDSPESHKFSSATGAEKLIAGSIYLEAGLLIIKSSLKDAKSGEIEYVFNSVSGNPEQPSKIIEELMQRIISYYTIKKKSFYAPGLKHTKPPSLASFIELEKGLEIFGKNEDEALKHFQKSIQLDSNFIHPYFWSIASFTNRGRYAEGDSVLSLIHQKFSSLNLRTQLICDWNANVISGDLMENSKTLKRLLDLDPKDPTINYLAGTNAFNLNQPQKAIDIFNLLDPKLIDFNKPSYAWWNLVYSNALIKLKRYPEALQILDYVPKDFGSISFPLNRVKIFMLNNQIDSLQSLINTIENQMFFNGNISNIYSEIGRTYGLLNDEAQQKGWYKKAIKWIDNQPEGSTANQPDLADAHHGAENYSEALPLYEQLLNKTSQEKNYPYYIFYKKKLGILYTQLNFPQKAQVTIDDLKAINYSYDQGRCDYAIGSIMLHLGKKQEAVQWLKQAFQNGYRFDTDRYGEDLDLIKLKDYPDFKEFIKPK